MGLAILVAVVINIIFSLFQEYRAERAVQVIKKPQSLPGQKAIRSGQMKEIAVTDAVPGDVFGF